MPSTLCDYQCDNLNGRHVCRCRDCGHTITVSVLPVRRNCPTKHQPPLPAHVAGPGTQLSRLLKRFGIEPTPTCSCRAKAAEMDAWGADECEKPERIEEVVAVMREEAARRGLPFVDMAGRLLVRRAIRNARKAAS
jgi:hypothetical protein